MRQAGRQQRKEGRKKLGRMDTLVACLYEPPLLPADPEVSVAGRETALKNFVGNKIPVGIKLLFNASASAEDIWHLILITRPPICAGGRILFL